MKKTLMKKLFLSTMATCAFNASAVHVNPEGLGDALLIPYYTVNNDLNTLVTVTNTKSTSKAVKINIREGLNGHAVLSYNVYLGPFDTWSFALVATQSTVSGNEGQDSAFLASADASCAPFLLKAGQEFLPFEFIDGPNDLSRAREGFIEVVEMGELTGELADFVDQGTVGVPENCAGIVEAWSSGGIWDESSGGNVEESMTAGSGGLMAETNVINVAEGINFSIPVVAFEGFFADDTIAHANPGDTSLSLDAAEPIATVTANANTYQMSFESGIDAVSAVLMSDELISTYALDNIVAGKSEVVFVQPTRRFYIDEGLVNAEPPYTQVLNTDDCSDQNYGGTGITQTLIDREGQVEFLTVGGVTQPPSPHELAICSSVYVFQMLLPDTADRVPSITGSGNYRSLETPTNAAVESGFSLIEFLGTLPLTGTDVNTEKEVELMGLPILGVALQQYTNGGAQAGLLAQYGGAQKIKSRVRVIEQN